MRLSLRTLLAFADNVYESESRQLVESRIREQKSASLALARITEVVRSPRVGAPGDEFNPNLTAAYLDHFLSDDETTRFEDIVFRSDNYLAEAASCHHILTSVLGEPARINRQIRSKIYAIPREREIKNEKRESSRRFKVKHSPEETVEEKSLGEIVAKRRPVSESLRAWEQKRRTWFFGVSAISILVFVGVLAINVAVDSAKPRPHAPKMTAVDVTPLMIGSSNDKHFEENRSAFETPLTKSILPAPTIPVDLPSDSAIFAAGDIVYSLDIMSAPPYSADNEFNVLPEMAVVKALEMTQLAMSSPPTVSFSNNTPVPEIQATPLTITAVSPRENTNVGVTVSPQSSPLRSFMQVSSQAANSTNSTDLAVKNQNVSPSLVVTERETISLETARNPQTNQIHVIDRGNTPSVKDVMNRELPPLIPVLNSEEQESQHEKTKTDATSSQESAVVPTFIIDYPVFPVSYLKKSNDVSDLSNEIQTDLLKLSEPDIVFTAKDENSYWERAVNEKSLKNEYLLVPAPFQAKILLANGLELTIVGDTRVKFQENSQGMSFDYGDICFDVSQVRNFPVTFQIHTAVGSGAITLTSSDSTAYLKSFDQKSQSYSPHLLLIPGNSSPVHWTSDAEEKTVEIRSDSFVYLNKTCEHTLTQTDGQDKTAFLKNWQKSQLMDIPQQKLMAQLSQKIKNGATLELALNEFLQDSSPEIRYWGCRWGAELGRVDLPVGQISAYPTTSKEFKQIQNYLNEVRVRDPETVKRLEIVEKEMVSR